MDAREAEQTGGWGLADAESTPADPGRVSYFRGGLRRERRVGCSYQNDRTYMRGRWLARGPSWGAALSTYSVHDEGGGRL